MIDARENGDHRWSAVYSSLGRPRPEQRSSDFLGRLEASINVPRSTETEEEATRLEHGDLIELDDIALAAARFRAQWAFAFAGTDAARRFHLERAAACRAEQVARAGGASRRAA